jgi:hypothetical protein
MILLFTSWRPWKTPDDIFVSCGIDGVSGINRVVCESSICSFGGCRVSGESIGLPSYMNYTSENFLNFLTPYEYYQEYKSSSCTATITNRCACDFWILLTITIIGFNCLYLVRELFCYFR